MDTLEIQMPEGKVSFQPGEPIAGVVVWELAEPAEAIELRLGWSTRGKGSIDIQVVDCMRIEKPAIRGEQAFCFGGSKEPFSFSGKLISLIWSLRLMAWPRGLESHQKITISPTGSEIDLYGSK